jgi:hypothetical protein
MHLRRALLLFAIVLGMAALVASLSRPIEDRRGGSTTPTGTEPETSEPGPPTATPGGGGTAEAPAATTFATISFDAAEPRSKTLEAGESATVEVSVDQPGSVDIPDMGLTAPADPFTPARFDVLASRPGRYRVLFTPAGGEHEPEPAGSLVVTSRG